MAKPSIMTDEDFRTAAKAGQAPKDARLRKGFVADIKAAVAGERTLDFTISTDSVDRMGDTIAIGGWRLENYKRNPVILWAHDSDSMPVAKASNIRVEGGKLKATAEFMPADISSFAESVFQAIKAGFLSATSVGFTPIKYAFVDDPARRFGIDFEEQELLEFSIVPVPANAEALIEGRSAGVDAEPFKAWARKLLGGEFEALRVAADAPRRIAAELRKGAKSIPSHVKGARGIWLRCANIAEREIRAAAENWKMGASRDLPVDSSDAWDGAAAAGHILDAAGFDGDSPDSTKARRGFLAYDSANPTLRGSYKLPFADIVGGEMKAVKGGVDAAAQRLSGTDIPQSVKDEAQNVIDAYQSKMGEDASKAMDGCTMQDCPMDPGGDPADCPMQDCPMKAAKAADASFRDIAARRLRVLKSKAA